MRVFSQWVQSLSSLAVSKFLRAASLGVQLNESWVVGSAAAYIWNYSNHMMHQGRQHEIVTSLQSVLDAIKAVEMSKYQTLTFIYANMPCCTADLSLSLRLNGHFPGGLGLAGTRMSPFWIYWT